MWIVPGSLFDPRLPLAASYLYLSFLSILPESVAHLCTVVAGKASRFLAFEKRTTTMAGIHRFRLDYPLAPLDFTANEKN